MTADSRTSSVRHLARAVALVPAPLVLFGSAPAFAAPPEQWQTSNEVSTLTALLVLVVIPVALFVGITLLVYVPSMAKGERYTPGLAWRGESMWFGGPRGGVEAVDRIEPEPVEGSDEEARGGASARW